MAKNIPKQLQNGLVMWLDSAGKDLSGTWNNGTLNGSPTKTRVLQNDGLAFTTSMVNFWDVLDFEYNESFTKSFWNKTTDWASAKHLMSKQSSSTTYWPWIEISLWKYACWLYQSLSSLRRETSLAYNDWKWRMVTFTYNGNWLASWLIWYIDWLPVTLSAKAGDTWTITQTMLNTTWFQINGRWNSTTDSVHTGTIINPMIWNRALSATEIQLLHKATFIK